MTVKFTNNASTTVGTGINASATSLTVASASSFPSLSGADDYCYLTLQAATSTTREVVKATALSGNTFTIVRAQDNTSAATFAAGDIVELRMTAALLTDVIDAATVEGVKTNFQYTPTAGQTVFSGADNASNTMIINQAALVSVYMNGVRLVQGTDYNVSSANNTVTLTVGATTADIIDIEVFGNFTGQSGAAVAITGGAISGASVAATTLSASGTATLNTFVSNNITVSGGSINNVNIGATTAGTGRFSTLAATGNATFSGNVQGTRLGANAAPNSNYAVNALQNGSMTHAGYFQANGDDVGVEVNATASGAYSSSVLYVRQSGRNTGGNLARFANSDGDQFVLTTSGTATFSPNSGTLDIKVGTHDATNNVRLNAGGTTSTYLEYRGYLGHIFDVNTTRMMTLTSTGLGISTSSPASPLTINGNDPLITFENGESPHWQLGFENTNSDRFVLYDNNANAYRLIVDNSGNAGINTTSPNSYSNQTVLTINGTSYGRVDLEASGTLKGSVFGGGDGLNLDAGVNQLVMFAGGSEAGRFDASQNFVLGGTNSRPAEFSHPKGISFRGDIGQIQASTDGNIPIVINRDSSDGDLIYMLREGSVVGSIATTSSRLSIGSNDVGLFFDSTNERLTPIHQTNQTDRDAAIDLGYGSSRFKDLYLSGVAKVDSYISLGNNGYIRGDASGELRFQGGSTATTFYNSDNSAERMRINNNGSIAINSTSTTRELTIQAPTNGPCDVTLRAGDDADFCQLLFGDTSADNQGIVGYKNGDEFMFFNTNGGERMRIDSSGNVNIAGGNLDVGTDSATVNFTDSNSGYTKYIEIGSQGATGNGDALLVTHAPGKGVGYFGYEAANDRLIIATDNGGGNNSIEFSVNAGTTTGGGTDNLNGATSALTIDGSGAVTMPSQPAFSVGRVTGGSASFSANTLTTTAFTTEIFDQGSDYNTSNHTFTAPVTGKYQLNAHLRLDNIDAAANYYVVYIKTSNRNYYHIIDPRGFDTDPAYYTMQLSALADMDANDIAYVQILQSGGANQTVYTAGSGDNGFSGYLVA